VIVDKDLLKQFNLFDKLPENFRNLRSKQYFVFYYMVDEEELRLNIFDDEVKEYMDITLYRGLNETMKKFATSRQDVNLMKIGYFRDTNESRDGLFYLFLRSFYTNEEVQRFYNFTKKQDEGFDIAIKTDFTPDIVTSEDFKKLIGFFCKGRLQTIMLIYDMVNNSFQRRLSQPLYGAFLTRAVKMVKYSAGVLPEIGGTFRFMVIGEKARLTDEQTNSLKQAKDLLRADYKPIDVYTKTGWGFSMEDGLWRTNISDANAAFLDTYLFDYDGNKLYIPNGSSRQMVLNLLGNPENIYNLRYTGRLSDVLKHDKLFYHYPRLANLPLLYYSGNNLITNQNTFHFSPTTKGGYIIIKGNSAWGNVQSILLHEIQHAVQNVEGFARGGNQYLAQFVSSLGAESVRKIFASINLLEKSFIERFDSEQKRVELLSVLQEYVAKTQQGVAIRNKLIQEVSNPSSFADSKTSINFYLVSLIGADDDVANNEIVVYLADSFTDRQSFFYDMIQNVVDGQESAKKYRNILFSKGYSQEDVANISFVNYLRLYGEMESRSVQHSRTLDGEFRNYFTMTSWEREPEEMVTVIDKKVEILDVNKIKAAVETKDDKYVLHFERGIDCIPYLHELGHIVHDALRKLGHGEVIQAEYDKTIQFENVDEFFVAKFLTFIRERIDDQDLQKDFYYKLPSESNAVINKILDDFFIDDEVNIRLRFLQELLKMVAL